MPTLISGISGVRGIINDGFDPDVVTRYTIAFGRMVGGGKIVIAQDTRPSGKMFKDIVESVLQSVGCDVIDCGICPTPTAQLLVEKYDANGGIIVTASHNPIEWNALKFVGRGGLFLDTDQHAELMRYLAKPVEKLDKWEAVGDVKRQHDAIQQHIDDVLNLDLVDAMTVKKRHPKVVVDAINGAGSKALPEFLEALGCEVVRMNCDNDGNFVHTPEPTPANLIGLRERVRQENADLGLATDPDADRLAVIDENGDPLVEEYTLVLAAYHALRHATADGKVLVTNLSTTMALDDLARRYGRKVLRTPVGEIHVARQMQQQPTLIGGEGNGGVILPECHLGRDSLVGAGLILTLLAETGQSISEIANDLPRYRMVKDKIQVGSANAQDILTKLAEQYKSENPILADGVKLTWPDRWVHFRASNTEPIIRVFAEAKDEATAADLVREFKTTIEALL